MASTEACPLLKCISLDAPTVDAITGNAAVGGSGSALLATNITNTYIACGPGGLSLPIRLQMEEGQCMEALRTANPSPMGQDGVRCAPGVRGAA